MTKFVLAAGTDVGEMALFSVDALSGDRCPHPDVIKAMEEQYLVVRFPTGSDGGYLLHAYVDEVIPHEVAKYCVKEDQKSGRLFLSGGRLGFGGIESLFMSFKPNPNIRSDCMLSAGDYEVTAFRTIYPDEFIEAAVEAKIGKDGLRLLTLPAYVIAIAVLLTLFTLAMQLWYTAAAIVVATILGLKVFFFSKLNIKRLQEEKKSIEMGFPSIVVEMRSKNVPGDSPR